MLAGIEAVILFCVGLLSLSKDGQYKKDSSVKPGTNVARNTKADAPKNKNAPQKEKHFKNG